jgi:hypothetical protein
MKKIFGGMSMFVLVLSLFSLVIGINPKTTFAAACSGSTTYTIASGSPTFSGGNFLLLVRLEFLIKLEQIAIRIWQ